MNEHGNDTNKEESKRQTASGDGQGKEQQSAPDGAGAGAAGDRKVDGAGWDGVNDGIDRAEADVSQMMDDLEYIRAKVRVLRGRYG